MQLNHTKAVVKQTEVVVEPEKIVVEFTHEEFLSLCSLLGKVGGEDKDKLVRPLINKLFDYGCEVLDDNEDWFNHKV